MEHANIGLSKEQRENVAKVLNTILADETVLYQKTRNFHWNVQGPRFNDLHEFFEEHYNELETIIDDVAERVRAVGVYATGTLKEFAQLTRVNETPNTYPSAEEMLQELLTDHETIIQNLRADIKRVGEEYNDVGTEDFLTGLLTTHEKNAWMIRSLTEE